METVCAFCKLSCTSTAAVGHTNSVRCPCAPRACSYPSAHAAIGTAGMLTAQRILGISDGFKFKERATPLLWFLALETLASLPDRVVASCEPVCHSGGLCCPRMLSPSVAQWQGVLCL
jgi:hypothetical protein